MLVTMVILYSKNSFFFQQSLQYVPNMLLNFTEIRKSLDRTKTSLFSFKYHYTYFFILVYLN